MTDHRPHVLFMTYDGLTDPLGQSQVLPYIEGLTDAGYRFSLVTFEKPDRFAESGAKLRERCVSKGISWHPLSYTKRPPVVSTLYDMRRLYRMACDIHKEQSVAMVHSRSYLPCIIALKLKEEFGVPFLFDMRGFYADERVDGKIWDLHNPLYKAVFKYFKKREQVFLKEAGAVVSLTQSGRKAILKNYADNPLYGGGTDHYNYDRQAAAEQKIAVIPCTADLDHFDYRRVTDEKVRWLAAVHGIDPALTYLGYVGSLGTWYMLDEMLAFYAELIKQSPEVRLLVLTRDATGPMYEKAAALGIPQSYIVHTAASRKDVPAFMRMMAASIFFILPTYSKKASSPTKQGELMAMGVPVICNAGVGDADAVVKRTGAGLVLSSFDKPAMAALAAEWEELIKIEKSKIRAAAEESFSLMWAVDAYTGLYRRVMDQREPLADGARARERA